MGQHRNVTDHEIELVVGNPDPRIVGPDEVFTVDDDADEVYAVEGVYAPVSAPQRPPVPPAPAAPVPAAAPASPATPQEA